MSAKILNTPEVSWKELKSGVMVEGAPGSGKTHLVAEIIRAMYKTMPVWVVSIDPFEDLDNFLEGIPIVLNPNPEVQSVFKPGKVYVWMYPVVRGLMPDEWVEKLIVSLVKVKREKNPDGRVAIMIDPAFYVPAATFAFLNVVSPRLNIGYLATFQDAPPEYIRNSFVTRIVLNNSEKE